MHNDSMGSQSMEEVVEYAGSSQPKQFRAMVPQVAASIFAVTIAFMLLLPFVRLTLIGSAEPETLLFLTKTDFGLNIFALVLLLVPVAGIAASLALREHKALVVEAVLAVIGLIMAPLAMVTLSRATGSNALLAAHVTPGIGMILVSLMLLAVAIGSGIAWVQTRH